MFDADHERINAESAYLMYSVFRVTGPVPAEASTSVGLTDSTPSAGSWR